MAFDTDLITGRVFNGDAIEVMSQWPSDWVDVCMFSPPYWGQKDYGISGQVGSESGVGEYTDTIIDIMDGVRRVLKPTGVVYLNMNDKYLNKSRQMVPERVVIRLFDDGWCIRQVNVWEKTNPMPDNATDRRSTVTEWVYQITPNSQYWYNHEEAKVEAKLGGDIGIKRNPKNVVRTSTASYSGDHTAAYPMDLCNAFIPQSCPPKTCSVCGEPYDPVVKEEEVEGVRDRTTPRAEDYDNTGWNHNRSSWVGTPKRSWIDRWESSCEHNAAPTPGVVLDPMCGTGTTMKAAQELGRRWVGIELNPDHALEAAGRVGTDITTPSPTTKTEADD